MTATAGYQTCLRAVHGVVCVVVDPPTVAYRVLTIHDLSRPYLGAH